MSTKDEALDDLVKVGVPSQHEGAIFVSQFRSLTLCVCVKMYGQLEHKLRWHRKRRAPISVPLSLKEPCIQDDAGARAWGRVPARVTKAADTYTPHLILQQREGKNRQRKTQKHRPAEEVGLLS